MNNTFSLWYIPENSVALRLSEIITELADRFQAVPFEPHVTGFSGIFSTPERDDSILLEIIRKLEPFSLSVTGVGQSSNFFRTLFLNLAVSPTLKVVANRLGQNYGRPAGFELEPHLSLLYQDLDEKSRLGLIDPIQGEFSEIRFTEIWLVRPRNLEIGWRDIGDWDVFHKSML